MTNNRLLSRECFQWFADLFGGESMDSNCDMNVGLFDIILKYYFYFRARDAQLRKSQKKKTRLRTKSKKYNFEFPLKSSWKISEFLLTIKRYQGDK